MAQIPAAIRDLDQWVCWKYITRGGKQTKCPIDAKTGGPAASTDASTWSALDVAMRRAAGLGGVGFVFTEGDPFCGIDLDECIDEHGVIAPAAKEIIETFASYTEVSPSGRGVKIIIEGTKPEGAKSRSKAIEGFKEIEVYDAGRFFTITGQRVDGCPLSIERRQDELNDLCARLWPPKPDRHERKQPAGGFDGDDLKLLDIAMRSKDGDSFRRLYDGDTSLHAGDHSAADLALCNKLAFWTGRDADRMDHLFRGSGLYREKWDRDDYRGWTLDKAIADCAEVYKPSRNGKPYPPPPKIPSSPTGEPPPGTIDTTTGRLILSTKRTLPTAESFIEKFHHHPDGPTLRHYAGMLMHWRHNRYVETEDDAVRSRLLPWMHEAVLMVFDKKAGEWFPTDFPATPQSVNAALDSVKSHVFLAATTVSPSWLGDSADRPDPREILPCRSSLLHLPTMRTINPTPGFFSVNALDFDPDPGAPEPKRWLDFLAQLFDDDIESIELLQDWFGYCLTGDTSQEKMLYVVGPKRSGKGTAARVLTRLVGEGNVCGPTTGSLAGNFGLQTLIGKSLAIVSDARFSGENVATVIERLLCISGEDTLTVDRKHMKSVTMKLPTRFVFLSNELPRLADASGALAGRFMILRLTESFYGNEDVTLTQKLLDELPGILNWALVGWRRLRERGRFVQPASVADAVLEMQELSSPVAAFVRERCVVGGECRVWLDDIYNAWKRWCERDGRTKASTRQTFGRDLSAYLPSIHSRVGTGNLRFYQGVGLREDCVEL